MPRIARVIVPGCAYHATHRGNHREKIFFNNDDRGRYLSRLDQYAKRFEMEILAYCLMSNHVHLIVVGRKPDSLARAIGNAHRQYSRDINRENGWTGHLWANRFYSTALDGVHLWTAARYVETNPLRAGIVASAVDYRWSSARAHCSIETNDLLAPDRPFPGSIADWAIWLDYGAEEPGYEKIRRNTATGRPTGSPQFKSWIEEQTGRTLIQGRPGRRRKIRK